jgi:hypothetical protein
MASLFLVASGFDAALDRLAQSPTQSSLTVYSERGEVLLAYYGNLAACKVESKPGPAITPNFSHRT